MNPLGAEKQANGKLRTHAAKSASRVQSLPVLRTAYHTSPYYKQMKCRGLKNRLCRQLICQIGSLVFIWRNNNKLFIISKNCKNEVAYFVHNNTNSNHFGL
jgi:hypothetical protein